MKNLPNNMYSFAFLLSFTLIPSIVNAQLVFSDDNYVYKYANDSTGLYFNPTATAHSFLNSTGQSVMNINTETGTTFNFGGILSIVNQPIFGNVSVGLAGISNTAEINFGAYVASEPDSNNIALYTDGDATVTGNIFFTSDGNLKQPPMPIDQALEKVLELNPVSYYFNAQEADKINLPSDLQNGFIAQEVKALFPELVKTVYHPEFDESGNLLTTSTYQGVNYIGFIPVLVEALQAQHSQIAEQDERINELESKLNALLNNPPTLPTRSEYNEPQPNTYLSNYPNPFKGNTTISYELPQEYQKAFLKIFDMNSGRLIDSLPLSGKGKGSLLYACTTCTGAILTATLWVDGELLQAIKIHKKD